MSRDGKILRGSLLAGAIYFGCIALAHTTGLKIPGLFIYFNVPSHLYQDHIIAFLAFCWATFFYGASDDPVDHPLPVKAILLSSAVAIGGLFGINAFSDFGSFSPSIKVLPFWLKKHYYCLATSFGYSFFIKGHAHANPHKLWPNTAFARDAPKAVRPSI